MSEFNACISNSVTLYTCNLQSMSGLQRPVSDDNNDRQSLELSRVVTILFCNIVLKWTEWVVPGFYVDELTLF